MVSQELKIANVLFFGAGKIGYYWLKRASELGITPKGFIDNNHNICGDMCGGIMIYSPENLQHIDFSKIFITCGKKQEIYRQLIELGITKQQIVIDDHDILNHLLYYSTKKGVFDCYRKEAIIKSDSKKVIFDMYNGLVLGGVESWCYDLAKRLSEEGYQGMYLTTDNEVPTVKDYTYSFVMLSYKKLEKDKDKIGICVQNIIENLPCTMVCDFPQAIFWAACIAKHLYPDKIKIIAVQHSDDLPYYEVYSLWQEYMDQCMVISSRIENKLLKFGMKQDKIAYLKWQIPCRERIDKIDHKKDRCLQIGYAGRIALLPKRMDLLLVLAKILNGKGINFQINIAGIGDYLETLQQKIQEDHLQECIKLIGYIDRKDIPDFWRKQDIMVSCSELEGHSISQLEAMAEGAVPVITDVSGARDDVTDEYNGYIVDVGDIDTMADRIAYLYHNREELERMGKHAHKTIYERQKNADQAKFWDDLIKKVWQE